MRAALLVLPLLVTAGDVDAQAERHLGGLLGASVNELGLQGSVDAAWKWGLYESDSLLLSESHVTLGGTGSVAPSFGSLEAWGVLAPLSVLDVRAGVEGRYYLGTFSSLLAFGSPFEDFSSDTRRERKDEARAGAGVRLFAEPSVQFRIGRVEAQSTFGYEWWKLDSAGPWVYEPRRDTLLLADGDVVYRLSSTALVRLGDGGVRLGLRHELTHVTGVPENDIQRLGGLLLLQSSGRRFGMNRPLFFLNVYYYLEDRYKKGEIGATVAVRMSFGGP